jgi:hypothetical protein
MAHFGQPARAPVDERIRLLGLVADVAPPLEANLVLMPTTVSAGANIKVLVAMAIRRAVVSASSGCAGLGLTHGHNVWIADAPEAFASSVAALITDAPRRQVLAEAACEHARTSFRPANLRRETAPVVT